MRFRAAVLTVIGTVKGLHQPAPRPGHAMRQPHPTRPRHAAIRQTGETINRMVREIVDIATSSPSPALVAWAKSALHLTIWIRSGSPVWAQLL